MSKFAVTLPSVESLYELNQIEEISRYIVGNNTYSIRVNTDFSTNQLKTIIQESHKYNKEVFIAINKIFHEKELSTLKKIIFDVIDLNIDGIIFSDFAILDILEENNISIKTLYNSDTTVTNNSFTKMAKQVGINEIELAKEITLKDIAYINENKYVPIQVMIHGHMYMYHSYRSLINTYSKEIKKDLNTENLYLYDDERNLKYPIIQNESGTHILSAYNLDSLNKIEKIFALNIDYLKLDNFGYNEQEFLEIVKIYIDSYRLYQKLIKENMIKSEFQLKIKKHFETIKNNNKDKKYSMGFLFKKSIY